MQICSLFLSFYSAGISLLAIFYNSPAQVTVQCTVNLLF